MSIHSSIQVSCHRCGSLQPPEDAAAGPVADRLNIDGDNDDQNSQYHRRVHSEWPQTPYSSEVGLTAGPARTEVVYTTAYSVIQTPFIHHDIVYNEQGEAAGNMQHDFLTSPVEESPEFTPDSPYSSQDRLLDQPALWTWLLCGGKRKPRREFGSAPMPRGPRR